MVRAKKGSVDSRLGCDEACEASKAGGVAPRNKRIMRTRFDVLEYLISRESLLTVAGFFQPTKGQTFAPIEAELTKDQVVSEVTSRTHD